jgi:hypothetical protein
LAEYMASNTCSAIIVFLLCSLQMVFALAAKFEINDIDNEMIRSFDVFAIFTSAGNFSEIIELIVAKKRIRIKTYCYLWEVLRLSPT